jgi:hypothetical protein
MVHAPALSGADLATAARTFLIPITADSRMITLTGPGADFGTWTFPSAVRSLPRMRPQVVALRILDDLAVEHRDLRLVGTIPATAEHDLCAVYTATVIWTADHWRPGVLAMPISDGVADIDMLRPTGLANCLRTALLPPEPHQLSAADDTS